MKTKIIGLIFFLGFNFLFSQQNDLLYLEGKIGKYPVSMNLFLSSDENGITTYTGNYYYHSQEIPIAIFQKENNSNQLTLYNGGDEDSAEIFDGILENGTYKGVWKQGKKSFQFKLKDSSKKNSIELVHLKNSREVPVYTLNDNDKISGTYLFDWILPKDENLQRYLVENLYLFFSDFEEKYSDFTTFTTRVLDDFESEYTEEINSYLKEFEDENEENYNPYSWNYSYDSFFYPYINTARYLVISYYGYQYTGGAHGISYQKFATFDKKKNTWLNLSDVLNLENEEEITQVLDKKIRKEYQIPIDMNLNEPENSIFISAEIFLSHNFTLSKKGITFHYGLYDMTPYVYGFFDLFVPYEDLKPYLNKQFSY